MFGLFNKKTDEPWRKLVELDEFDAVNPDTGELIEVKPKTGDGGAVEGLFVRFAYENAQGERTRRGMICHKAWKTRGSLYVRGQCTLRDDLRTFRPDRMSRLEEVRTRRQIADAIPYFDLLAEDEDAHWDRIHAERKQKADQETEQLRRLSDARWNAGGLVRDGLRVLAFVALSDGEKSAAEAAAIDAYVASRLADPVFDEFRETVSAELAQFGAALAPSRRSFGQAVGRVLDDKDHLAVVFEQAIKVARSDGAERDEEVSAVAAIVKAAKKRYT